MQKSIDLLSKNLASGMSRRKAFWQFITGLGAVGALGSLGAKKASAASNVNLLCTIGCSTQAQEITKVCRAVAGNNVVREIACNAIATEFQNACLQASSRCRSGFCAEFVGVNGTSGITTASFNLFESGGGDFTCIPPGLVV
jgi:hypothetical protein